LIVTNRNELTAVKAQQDEHSPTPCQWTCNTIIILKYNTYSSHIRNTLKFPEGAVGLVERASGFPQYFLHSLERKVKARRKVSERGKLRFESHGKWMRKSSRESLARATYLTTPSVFSVDSDHQQMKSSTYCAESLCRKCTSGPVSLFSDPQRVSHCK